MSSPSPPTAELGELAVSDPEPTTPASTMVMTRNQARSKNMRRAVESEQLYNLVNIQSNASNWNVHAALNRRRSFNVQYCEQSDDMRAYRFTLNSGKPIIVVPRASSPSAIPKCNCQPDAHVACEHIFWLIDRIAEVPGAMPNDDQAIKLFENGSSEPRLASMIDRSRIEGLEAVMAAQSWPDTPEEDLDDQSTQENIRTLFSLDPNPLAFDGNVGMISPEKMLRASDREISVKYRSLSGMLVNRAFADRSNVLRRELGALREPEFQQLIVFEKYRAEAKTFLERLDLYSTDLGYPALDVHACATKLRELVDRVGKAIEQLKREDKETLTKLAVGPLVYMLADVVLYRDIDAYRVINWNREGQSDERAINLFAQLFLEEGTEKLFILGILSELEDVALSRAAERDSFLKPLMEHIRSRFAERKPDCVGDIDEILRGMNQ